MGKLTRLLITLPLMVVLASASNGDDCMKDILVVLDTSYSIGQYNFERKVKPFLKQLINEPELNVSPAGTHVAILAFSTMDKTQILLPFAQGYDTLLVNKTVSAFDWDSITGGQTRTDYAFKKASQIFKGRSPSNHRPKYGDVILLITDGEPHGINNARERAIIEARKLKDKGILIVGLGVGNVDEETLQAISSPGEAIEATFENIHTILDKLIAGSCRIGPAGTCTCSAVDLGDLMMEPNSITRQVTWDIPQPDCTNDLMEVGLMSTVPDVRPGHSFPIGRHSIEYSYRVSGDTDTQVKCDVSFEVKGSDLCRGKSYSKVREVCCCGTVHEMKENFECCGMDYYAKATHKCCPGSTVREIQHACFGPPCKCPAVNLGTKYIKEGGLRTSVTWVVPRPSCGGRLHSVTPNRRPGHSFTPGVHMIEYLYRTSSNFDITCTLRFEVKVCRCPLPVLGTVKVTPGDTSAAVTWNDPLPTCSEAITDTTRPHAKSGQSFAIGQHTVLYTYNVNNQFELRCGVMFEVRGALCRKQGYDSTKQVCCCGTVHNTIPGHDCCGQDYYTLTTHKCCQNSVVRHKAVSCPRE